MKKKIKIAVFFPSMTDGGAERVTLNLIQYLAKNYEYPIDLVLASATGPFMDQVPDNVRVIDLKAGRVMASLPALIKYLRTERPSVLLSGMDYVNVIALIGAKLSFTGVRTVVCLHINLTAQLANPDIGRGRLIVPFLKVTHRWADVIVGTSKGCGEDFKKVTGVGEKNMEFIYNPVITETLAPKAAEPVDHRWFVEDSPPVILAVGRMAHQKNYGLLVRAFDIVRQTNDVRLLILGDGDKRQEIEKQISELGLDELVDTPGFVINPYSYMAKSAMFVLSSHYEALPAVLIEAMYCGTQLVSTDCPSGPNEILDGGKYGQLVPTDDAEKLAEAMIIALSNKEFKQSENACDRFIDANVVDRYLDVLTGVEAEHR